MNNEANMSLSSALAIATHFVVGAVTVSVVVTGVAIELNPEEVLLNIESKLLAVLDEQKIPFCDAWESDADITVALVFEIPVIAVAEL